MKYRQAYLSILPPNPRLALFDLHGDVDSYGEDSDEQF